MSQPDQIGYYDDGEWDLGLGIGISNWGLGFMIAIGDWGLRKGIMITIFDFLIEHFGLGLGLGIKLMIRIGIGIGDYDRI